MLNIIRSFTGQVKKLKDYPKLLLKGLQARLNSAQRSALGKDGPLNGGLQAQLKLLNCPFRAKSWTVTVISWRWSIADNY